MATKKIILDFRTQPIVDSYFRYQVYVNGSVLKYDNGLDIVDIKYKAQGSGNINPTDIALGLNLNDTIDRTLLFLNSADYNYEASLGGYPVSVSYERLDNTIEVSISIEISGVSESIIRVWKVLCDFNRILIRPENPCEYAYLSNAVTLDADEIEAIYSLPNGNYRLRNNDLNTVKNVTIPTTIDCYLQRGYTYNILNGLETVASFYTKKSIVVENLTMYFAGDSLYVILSGFDEGLTFMYSLDGFQYQSSNVFSGLSVGSYTVYIKDSLGCVKTFEMDNPGTGSNLNAVTPYYLIPDANSLRFIKRVVHNNCSNYKNRFNTLSCEENTPIANKFIQLFQTCDSSIKTQLKTSYQNVEVGAGDTEITPTKIVRNIGIKDYRDARYLNYEGNLAITYTTGRRYDYDNGNVIGVYSLNGLLPEYAKIGTWLETDYGILQITNIIINDSGNRILIMNSTLVITDPTGRVKVIYNRENYDIWEFELNMSMFANLMFNVGIRLFQDEPDEKFPDLYFISEKISVKERWTRTIEVIWRNSKNTDVYFFSGITMKNRLAFSDISTYIADGTIENQRTDSQVISIEASNYNGAELEISNLTTGMVQKINLALKHDYLVINEVAYKLQDNPELERQGKSNFYKLTAKLLEAGDVWNNGTLDQQIYADAELIGLLKGDGENEFIQIK